MRPLFCLSIATARIAVRMPCQLCGPGIDVSGATQELSIESDAVHDLSGTPPDSLGWVLGWFITVLVPLLIGRGIFHGAIASRAARGCLARKIAIVGAGDEGQQLIARLQATQDKNQYSTVRCGNLLLRANNGCI